MIPVAGVYFENITHEILQNGIDIVELKRRFFDEVHAHCGKRCFIYFFAVCFYERYCFLVSGKLLLGGGLGQAVEIDICMRTGFVLKVRLQGLRNVAYEL